MPRVAALLVLLVAVGCDGAPTLRCPSDRRGASCDEGALADAGWAEVDAGSAPIVADAGSPRADAGGWSLDPPGTPPPDPGCDAARGECDAWEAELVRQIEAARSCSTPLTIDGAAQAIAQRQADYQAEVDRLTSASPDGSSLFDQLRAAGSSFHDAGAVFSVTRQGPSDVLARWRANAETAPIVAGCWTHAGAAFSTSTTGASYVTVLFLTR